MTLKDTALEYQKRAYAPYSHYQVGAAIEAENGSIFGGCNIENANYSGTICAERTAIVKAVSEGHRRFKRIVIVTPSIEPGPPCGFCLQVLQEFAGPELEVEIRNLAGTSRTFALRDLAPFPFSAKSLTS